jgi:hypothetical protein
MVAPGVSPGITTLQETKPAKRATEIFNPALGLPYSVAPSGLRIQI